jgi:outer membrane protein OmpA-like peptidoglycan-associated protein
MREQLLFLIVALAFVLSGCASPMSGNEQGPSSGTGKGAGSGGPAKGKARSTAEARAGVPQGPIPPGKVTEYMDRQEKELHEQFGSEENPTIRRDSDTLFITFKADLLFDFDSFALTAEASEKIQCVADILTRYPQTGIRVNGFTDTPGSERHNLELSQKRAMAVKAALVQCGIPSERIRARGFGETNPIRSNATDSGRHINRRVVVAIVPKRY